MIFKELQVSESPDFSKFSSTLKDEHLFIFRHGLYNCKILQFKNANSVISYMNEYDPNCLNEVEKSFILKHSNKEVLCYVSPLWADRPDIFVYGDDNIAFQVECFV